MNKKTLVIIPLLIAMSVAIGILIGNMMKGNATSGFAGINIGPNNKLSTILELVSHGYVDSVNTGEIVEETIPEVLKKLDPHSIYIPARDMQEVQEEMDGNFSGIGVQFSMMEDTVRVIEVVSGGPSSKVGIQPGDRIVTVNDSVIAGVNIDSNDVLHMLRGQKNSKVRVGVIRKGYGGELEFEIIRGDIPLYSVDVSYMIDDETGFIKISRFANTTYREFMDGMKKLTDAGAEKVIIDLRNNGGGSLMGVLQMLDEVLEKGEPILYTEGEHQPRKTYNASGKATFGDTDLYVLIDEFSASASEIFAGAIQDNDRGIVIGRRSFGKGLVQEQIPLMDGSALRLTVARFYTPSGRCIQSSYEDGNEEYYNSIYERFHNMEQLVADSIHFDESLKYTTKGGRIVYGGGGIMPDFFVPVDTTGNSAYYNRLFRRGLIYQYAYAFADQHRDELSDLTNIDDLEAYLNKKQSFEEFIRYAEEKGVKRDDDGLKESGDIIRTLLKAYTARNIMGEEGFFPIYQQIDKTLQRAIEISREDLLVQNLIEKQDSIVSANQ